ALKDAAAAQPDALLVCGDLVSNGELSGARTLAEKLKMRVKGLSAKTKLYFFPNAFVREFIGLLWEKKWKHLLFIFLFFAVLLVLYLIIRY
ncbi:MAG: hypothetical protein ABS987_12400, partial [Ruminococcus sp.]